MAIKLPAEIVEEIEILQKSSNVDPREYPGIVIKWQGCGDSGGIESMNFLTPLGLDYIKKHHCAPTTWQMRHYNAHNEPLADIPAIKDHYHTHPDTDHRNLAINRVTCATTNNRDIQALSQWVYEQWNLCEINDGGYGHIFIEVPFRKAWGESFDYVQEEVLNTSVDYVD